MAAAFARLRGDSGTAGQTRELDGRVVYTYLGILELILHHQGRRRLLPPLPLPRLRSLAALADRLDENLPQ